MARTTKKIIEKKPEEIVKDTKKVSVKTEEKKAGDVTIKAYSIEGKETGTMTLPDALFSVQGKPQLLAQYVRVYLNNQRQGTASTKTRGEVIGSTRKIYRQKGTGKARHGDIKAPIFVGGGVASGPKPRDYSQHMNKKQKKKALLYALTLKQKEGVIIGLENEAISIEPKTKIVSKFVEVINVDNKNMLFVLPKLEKNNLVKASSNIACIDLTESNSLNPYEVMKARKIVFIGDALAVLEKRLS